jgi:hypothetical protein
LLAVRTPKGPDVTVRWDDGTGTEMRMAPGATASAFRPVYTVQICITVARNAAASNTIIQW